MILGHQLAFATRKYEEIYLSLRPKLSLVQLILLLKIEEGFSRQELAAQTGLDAALINMILHRIMKRKLIERSSNSKTKATRLTPSGVKLTADCLKLAERAEKEFLHMLSPANGGDLRIILHSIETSSLYQIPSRRASPR